MIEDIIGNRFGSYTVISRDTKKLSSGAIGYVCKCDCGKIKSIRKFKKQLVVIKIFSLLKNLVSLSSAAAQSKGNLTGETIFIKVRH